MNIGLFGNNYSLKLMSDGSKVHAKLFIFVTVVPFGLQKKQDLGMRLLLVIPITVGVKCSVFQGILITMMETKKEQRTTNLGRLAVSQEQ